MRHHRPSSVAQKTVASVAQLVEQLTLNQLVVGSNPPRGTTFNQTRSMAKIKFGTDGWRAVIAEDFTFANVARVAQATADFWKSEISNPQSEIFGREPKVVVGYDRRFLSDRFAQITAEVFAGNGFQVILTPEPTPTPSISYALKNLGAVGGVMITASHNPPIFNGFKLKSHFGGSSDEATCKAVENCLDKNPVRREVGGAGI